jgi:CheY-like chemotaxis protein
LSVLLVEDHEINRKLAQIMLQRMGHAFVLANDGQQALDCLDKEHFDVVLLDVMMPVMDGLTALRIWREREAERQLPRTTVLMVTAHAMTGDRERFLSAGADGYVSKPMSQTILLQEIERVLYQSDEGQVGAQEH